MTDIRIETQPRKRSPMSEEQRAKLSVAQKAYVTNDPRWPEHRRKLAAAQYARRMTLFDNEVAAIIGMRKVLQWALIVASCNCAIWLLIAPLPC